MNDAERWSIVSELLSRALDLPESERRAFLTDAMRDRPSLRTEVLGMLEEVGSMEGFLETPAAAASPDPAGFGPYRLLGELGEGGMGIVYLAERRDGRLTRRVAIKRIGTAAPSSDLLRRFRDEGQILSQLDHANISRLIDAGVDDAGVPYLVMEHVEGVPLTAFCREQELGIERRLKLFLKICAAVQHAHQNLVIHRDIKPGNILVTEDEEPKLLDFGIAKLVNRSGPADATGTAYPVLTFDFASPEQLRGEPANTSNDVYALGVVLFELLADVKPYECGTRDLSEAVRLVCELVPPAPSQVAPAGRRAALTGDLDAIVRKALEKSPADRYATVADLAEDVAAHLDHLPVRARHPSLGYRAAKLFRRHRVAVSSAVGLVLLIAAGVAAVLWQARVAERERRRAEARFQDVRRLANAVIYEFHDAIANLPGATEARRVLIVRALEYLDRLASEARDDAALQRELAAAYQRMAQVQNGGLGANVGNTAGALESYAKAKAILESLTARDSPRPEDLLALGTVEFELGALHRATGELEQAERSMLSAVSRLESLAAEGTLPDPHSRLASVYQRVAELQTLQGRKEAALQWAAKAHSEAERRWLAIPDDATSRRVLAVTSYELASALASQGENQEALEKARRARVLLEEGLTENPLDAQQTRILLFVMHGEGTYLRQLGDLTGALEVREQALRVAEDAWKRDRGDRWSRLGVAVAANSLGDVLLASGRTGESISRFRQALSIASEAVQEDPGQSFARLEAASAEHGLGRALLTRGSPAEVAEGCALLLRVQKLWTELRAKGELPSNEFAELEGLGTWLGRCPSA